MNSGRFLCGQNTSLNIHQNDNLKQSYNLFPFISPACCILPHIDSVSGNYYSEENDHVNL